MAKKKGKKQKEAAEEISKFDAIDIKNQGQMLDALKEELGVRAKITTEQKGQLNVSRQLQGLGQQVLDNQLKAGDGIRTQKDIAKDLQKTLVLIDKLEKQTLDKRTKAGRIARDQLDIAEKLKKALEEEEKKRKNIEERVGLTGKLIKGVGDIPVIGKMMDGEKALGAMNKAAEDGAGKFKTMGVGILEVGKQIQKHMTDPLFIIVNLVKSGLQFDKEVTSLGKNLSMSREEAKMMRHEFSNMATDLGEMAITSTEMQAGFNMVNNALGTASTTIRADIVVEAGRMQKLMNMSEEAIMGFAGHAMRSGKDMKAIKIEALGSLNAVEKQTGIRLNETKMLEKVGKIQGQISAQLGGDPARIMEAAAAANSLGMELEAVAAAGKQMLNFEQSIAAELEAELLTGKQLNLERARLAALTGDYETLTEEINKNVGDFGDFSKMNVLQQDALAKSLGMTTDQLSNQLMKKADLKALAQEARDEGDEERARMLEQRNTQQEFNDLIVQLKQSFVDMAGGPVADFMKGLVKGVGVFMELLMFTKKIGKAIGDWMSPVTGLVNKMGTLGKILKGLAWITIIYAAYKAYASLATLPIIGVPLGLAASIGILAAGNAALNQKKADDAVIPGAPGYGKRALLEKGSVTLFNDRDTIVAGTNINTRNAAISPGMQAVSEQTATDAAAGGGGGEPMQVNVTAVQENDVFARTNKNAEDVFMVQTKSQGLFA